jgi:hypothetical protein
MIAIIITLTVFENAIFVLQRNPLAVAFGVQSRESYIARVNSSYAALMKLMDELPVNAYVYSLFEPRSYSLPRRTQPDAINYNFSHDLYLYKTSSKIIQQWKQQGYTHILIYERGLNLGMDDPSSQFTPARRAALHETLEELDLVSQTPDKVYSLYRIP